MIAPLQEGPVLDDHDGGDDYHPFEKMNPRPAGPMPANRHRRARIGSCRTRKYRATQARVAVTCGGIMRRRQKKVL